MLGNETNGKYDKNNVIFSFGHIFKPGRCPTCFKLTTLEVDIFGSVHAMKMNWKIHHSIE
jgi:hypothetical protein